MNKFLLLVFTFYGILFAVEYPKTFSKLGTPLYESVKPLSNYSDVKSLENTIVSFKQQADRTMSNGFEVDKSKEKAKIKEYLLELRKLQKSYDYLLHLLHDNINAAIDKNDYKLFVELTNYEFDGLLKNSNLRKKSIAFYNKNRSKQRSKFFEKKIKRERLIKSSANYSFEQVEESTYDQNSKNDSTKLVQISTRRSGNNIYVTLKNRNIYDITISVTALYKNVIQVKSTPKTFVLKANSTVEYTKLKLGVGKSYYRYGYSWIIGNINAVHDDSYIYRLPYEQRTRHLVSQGFNGLKTHKGYSKYAVDFSMEEGTAIYAARGGLVVKTKSDSNIGGYSKEFAKDGNYVTIAHSDGTFGTYYHLKQRGVAVRVGDVIQRGYVLGYSGNTGYSSGPHLHFGVFSAVSSKATQTIAVKFKTAQGVISNPITGNYYTAK